MRRPLALLLLILFTGAPAPVLGAEQGMADELLIARSSEGAAFTIDVRDGLDYKWFELRQPERFVIDFYGVQAPIAFPDVDMSGTPVVRVRSGYQPSQKKLRIVFDMKLQTAATVFALNPDFSGGRRIVIEFDTGDRAGNSRLRSTEGDAATDQVQQPAAVYPQVPEESEDSGSEMAGGEVSTEEDRGLPFDMLFGGTWEQEWAVDTDGGDSQKFESLIEPRLDLEFSGVQLTGIARVRLDTEGDLGPDQSSAPNYSDINGPVYNTAEVEVSLRELYLDFYWGSSAWRVGKQQVVWGEADGLKVLDVVNPQSFREFILDDFDDSRIPLWMVNAELPVGVDGSLQFLWIPDTTYHELAEPGSPFFITSPLLVPEPVPGLPFTVARPDKPSGAADADYGIRYSAFVAGWDLSFNYLYHYLDAPVFYQSLDMTPVNPVALVTPEYERSHLSGATLSNAFGDFTLRAEIAYNSSTYHTSTDLSQQGVSESAELASVLGLDWQLSAIDTFVSAQWFQSHLFDHEPETIRSETTNTMSLLVQKNFANDTWTLDAIGLYSVDDEDSLARLKLRHFLFDNLEVWVGVDIFSGDKRGLYGEFSEQDRATLGFELGF